VSKRTPVKAPGSDRPEAMNALDTAMALRLAQVGGE